MTFALSDGDWEGALWETVAHLQALIRLDTVNPPGDEIRVARYLEDVLRGAGIETTLLEPAPRRAALIGRIKGQSAADALLLMAHMDVVPVDRERWSTNPFGGEILDGYIYGRGAIDDKGMLASNLETMLLVQRFCTSTGRRPSRDVVFLATADEEAGGVHGIKWLLQKHRALLKASVALNEGGRIRLAKGKPLYCAIQCAEKVPHNVVVKATGTSGHAAVPRSDNSVNRLARALTRIELHKEPISLDDVTRGFLAGLAPVWPDREAGAAMEAVASNDPQRRETGALSLAQFPAIDATIRNTVSATMLKGGVRSNVIPAETSATLNVRTLPGTGISEVVERLRAAVNDPAVGFEVVSSGQDAPPSQLDGEGYKAITDALRELDPNIPSVPYLSSGATDSAALRRAGIQCYGVLPFPLTQEDEDRMHGNDERIPVNSLGFGVKLTSGIVERLAFSTSQKTA